jgi:hypothetical protein
MFPHNGKIITINQVSHYEPNPSTNIDNILPPIHTSHNAYPLIEMGAGIFKDPSLLGTYHGAPPLLRPSNQVCVISSNGTHIEDTLPPTNVSIITDIPLVAEPAPQEPPTHSSAPPVHDSPSPIGHIPVWETVPQAITQIPFFYPSPGIEDFQVATMLTLRNMVLAIPVWYLHPPKMVPQPSLPPQKEGIPLTIPILTPTTPPLTNPPATAGGRRKKKDPIAPLPPHIPPPCTLCEKEGHQTNNFPSLPELQNLIPLIHTPPTPVTTASPATTTTPSSSKGLRTKFSCAICSEYGHYTHHCLALPCFRQTLAVVRQNFQSNPSPAMSSSTNIIDIRYVTTSVNERMRCPCSLCDSLAHFTYQCPMILEYRQCQLTLLYRPVEAIIDITSSLEDLHVISLEPEALPLPPWFLDDLSKDSPPNPPPTLLLIPLWTLSTQPPRVPLITSIYGLCRVNPHHPLTMFPLLLHQGASTRPPSPRSLLMTPCIPVTSNATKKYSKS